MKNKKFTFFTAAICALPLIFSGCAGDFSDNEHIDTVSTDSEGGVPATEQTIEYNIETETSAAEEPTAFENAVEAFPIDTILLPDGSAIDKHKADRVVVEKNGEIKLEFDFWFLRYAKPVFQSNIDGFGEYRESWDRFETGLEETLDLKNEDFFKVEPGDALENGMKVTKASFTVNEKGWYRDVHVELSGEVTYEGVLLHYMNESISGYSKDDIILLLDPTKGMYIPIIYHGDYDDVKNGSFRDNGKSYSFGEQFVILDSVELILGNKDKLAEVSSVDLNNAFVESPLSYIDFSYTKAKTTISDMIFDGGNYQVMAANTVSIDIVE